MMKAWEKGAEIFPNLGCDGKTDMVLKIDGSLYEIDVKQMKWHQKGYWCSVKKVHAPGVWAVWVNPETRDVRWPYTGGGSRIPQCPPGLEDFWN